MKWKKTIGWGGLILLFVLMLMTAVVFLLASTPPAEYNPYRLTQAERKIVANEFGTRAMEDWGNKFMDIKPFTITLKEDELNSYLAAMDEIDFLRAGETGDGSTTLLEAMDKASLADPVIKMDGGVLTIMVRTKKSNKVISLDLAFTFDDEGRVGVVLRGVRIGRMPVPRFLLDRGLSKLKKVAKKRPEAEEVSFQDLDGLLSAIVAAIGEEPIPTVVHVSRKRARRFRDVQFEDGTLKIHVEPVAYEKN